MVGTCCISFMGESVCPEANGGPDNQKIGPYSELQPYEKTPLDLSLLSSIR